MTIAPIALRLAFAASVLAGLPAAFAQTASREDAAGASDVLVAVGDKPITRGDLDFQFVARKVPDDQRDAVRDEILERLIDDRLMQSFLESRNATAAPATIDAEIERLHESIRARGEDPRQVLGRLGYDDDALRRELALPVAWRNFARAAITPERLRQYFEKHRRKFDGTELKASQIFLKATTDVERESAMKKLAAIKQQIEAGTLTFPNAARLHSQAPTAAVGGDVGSFPYRGKMPEAFTREAFRIEQGKIGEPFATPFGTHLVTVTGVRPGQLSLEDVRHEVFDSLAAELWAEIIRQERQRVKIERHEDSR